MSDAVMWLLQFAAAAYRQQAEVDFLDEAVSASRQAIKEEAVDLLAKLRVSLQHSIELLPYSSIAKQLFAPCTSVAMCKVCPAELVNTITSGLRLDMVDCFSKLLGFKVMQDYANLASNVFELALGSG